MSGSEFERENILNDALSAAPDSKPAEIAREHSWRPPAEGMYDLSLEKDSCGVGFIANIKGRKSHRIVSDAIRPRAIRGKSSRAIPAFTRCCFTGWRTACGVGASSGWRATTFCASPSRNRP